MDVDSVRVIRVIQTTLTRRGKGIVGDPMRMVEQFWSLDGKLLAENDPCLGEEITEIEENR